MPRPIEDAELAEVQRRREPVVRTIQRIQAVIQERIVGETLAFGPRSSRLERADEHPPAV